MIGSIIMSSQCLRIVLHVVIFGRKILEPAGSNRRPLAWQADMPPLSHRVSVKDFSTSRAAVIDFFSLRLVQLSFSPKKRQEISWNSTNGTQFCSRVLTAIFWRAKSWARYGAGESQQKTEQQLQHTAGLATSPQERRGINFGFQNFWEAAERRQQYDVAAYGRDFLYVSSLWEPVPTTYWLYSSGV